MTTNNPPQEVKLSRAEWVKIAVAMLFTIMASLVANERRITTIETRQDERWLSLESSIGEIKTDIRGLEERERER